MPASTNMGHVTSFEVWEIETATNQYDVLKYQTSMSIPCPCGKQEKVEDAYRCLYCDIWFCVDCAGDHFGETKAAFLERKAKECQ